LPEAVFKLFCQCAELVGHGSRIAFSYIPTGSDGRPDAGRWTGLMLWLQKAVGEPWLWSVRPNELDAYLHDVGWQNAPELAKAPGRYGVELYAVAAK
jgi:O-methyltransferase involved in polyketide biosynthesis